MQDLKILKNNIQKEDSNKLDKAIFFRNKKCNLTLPLDYIRANRDKEIIVLIDKFGMQRENYKVNEIPIHEDWEIEIHYFTHEDIRKLYDERFKYEVIEKAIKIVRNDY